MTTDPKMPGTETPDEAHARRERDQRKAESERIAKEANEDFRRNHPG